MKLFFNKIYYASYAIRTVFAASATALIPFNSITVTIETFTFGKSNKIISKLKDANYV